MYSQYLELKKNKDEILKNYTTDHHPYEKDENIHLIHYLITQNEFNYVNYDINRWIFSDFPEHEYIFLLNKFIDSCETLHRVYPEYCKMIYHLWPKFMNVNYKDKPKNYPHNEIYELLFTIKTELKIIPEKIKNMYKNNIRQRGTRYMFWPYFALYPLLDNGFELLKTVSTFDYDDAQDGIMFAMYQINPFKNFDVVFDILKYWDEHRNIYFSSGTGMLFQLRLILEKYDALQFNYKKNNDFMSLLIRQKCDQ